MNRLAPKIIQLTQQDQLRMQVLTCLSLLDLPDSYVAAGFVRNLVWDHLHNKTKPTPLNDIDVIYFDLCEANVNKYKDYQDRLNTMMPEVNWQVRNQALMHDRNGDKPYKNSLDAMSHWPEKETAVAIRKLPSGKFECISAFSFESLFKLQLTHNPKRSKLVFYQRVKFKGWLKKWPNLTISPKNN